VFSFTEKAGTASGGKERGPGAGMYINVGYYWVIEKMFLGVLEYCFDKKY